MSSNLPRPRTPRVRGQQRRAMLLQILIRMRADGVAPTYADLSRELGVSITATRHHLRWLQSEGIVRFGPPRLNIEILRESLGDTGPQEPES